MELEKVREDSDEFYRLKLNPEECMTLSAAIVLWAAAQNHDDRPPLYDTIIFLSERLSQPAQEGLTINGAGQELGRLLSDIYATYGDVCARLARDYKRVLELRGLVSELAPTFGNTASSASGFAAELSSKYQTIELPDDWTDRFFNS